MNAELKKRTHVRSLRAHQECPKGFILDFLSIMPWKLSGFYVFLYFECPQVHCSKDYYSKHETSAKAFNELMTVHSSMEIPLVLKMVPWKNYSGRRVLDVGGGHGAVMGAVKNDFPEVQTLSFDMPQVIESAAGVTPPGVEMIAGDMFDVSSYPNKLDAIFMKHILHDWDDESCISILKACHGALNVGSKVFVADAIVPGPGETSATRLPGFQATSLLCHESP